MSEHDKPWNPEDGPPPTADELADARTLADALGAPSDARKRRGDADLEALVAVALRVRATAHPEPDKTKTVAATALEYAISNAGHRWYRSRRTWIAVAAAVLIGLGGGQWAFSIGDGEDASDPISRPATDVLREVIPNNARSGPIDRIVESRMDAYRDAILHARGAAARRSP
jgi:hypothetical protein